MQYPRVWHHRVPRNTTHQEEAVHYSCNERKDGHGEKKKKRPLSPPCPCISCPPVAQNRQNQASPAADQTAADQSRFSTPVSNKNAAPIYAGVFKKSTVNECIRRTVKNSGGRVFQKWRRGGREEWGGGVHSVCAWP